MPLSKKIQLLTCLLIAPVQTSYGQWADNYLFPTLSIASDYRYQGVSNSDTNPVVQGSIYIWRPDGYYGGLWLSRVDFNDPGATNFEVDTYLGKNIPIGPSILNLEVMYSAFDEEVPGPTYDFWQTKVGISRTFGRLESTLMATHIPEMSYSSGKVSRLETAHSYRIFSWLSGEVIAGSRWSAKGIDRTYWSAAVIASHRNIDFRLSYHDNNLNLAECNDRDICDGGMVAQISINFWTPVTGN